MKERELGLGKDILLDGTVWRASQSDNRRDGVQMYPAIHLKKRGTMIGKSSILMLTISLFLGRPVHSLGSCKEAGLCCTGRDASCVVQKTPQNAIIEDLRDTPCYCDHACLKLNDCCPDYRQTCGGTKILFFSTFCTSFIGLWRSTIQGSSRKPETSVSSIEGQEMWSHQFIAFAHCLHFSVFLRMSPGIALIAAMI